MASLVAAVAGIQLLVLISARLRLAPYFLLQQNGLRVRLNGQLQGSGASATAWQRAARRGRHQRQKYQLKLENGSLVNSIYWSQKHILGQEIGEILALARDDVAYLRRYYLMIIITSKTPCLAMNERARKR